MAGDESDSTWRFDLIVWLQLFSPSCVELEADGAVPSAIIAETFHKRDFPD